jgi:Domain of unknown function (DUF4397)
VKRISLAVVGVLVATVAGLVVGSPAQAADTASVSVVHGIPNTPVNVFVNGKSTLADFKPGTLAGPLHLPAGTYKITIFPASNTAGTGAPLLQASAPVEAGKDYTIVAHLKADGTPTITPFVNDISPMPTGMSRLIVRHTAAAPAVDIRAGGKVVFPGLTNPNEAKADLPPGTVSADVVLAGTSTVAIGPASLTLKEGTDTIVYATGSAAQKTLSLVVQEVSGLNTPPNGVPSGTGGYASTDGGTPLAVWLLSGFGVLLALAGGTSALRTVRSRR